MKGIKGGYEEAERDRSAHEAVDVPEDARCPKGAGACDADQDAERVVAGGIESDIESAAKKGLIFKDYPWDFIHAARSMAYIGDGGDSIRRAGFFRSDGTAAGTDGSCVRRLFLWRPDVRGI